MTCRIRFSSALIFAGVFAAGCGRRGSAAPPPAPPPQVAVLEIVTEEIELTEELPGRVSASLTAEVRPQASGIVQQRLFTEGADVAAGDILYKIDPSDYQAAFDSAQASLAVARARESTARAALAGARANVVPVRLRAQRFEELLKTGVVSQQDFDDAAAALLQAEAETERSEAAVEAAQAEIKTAEAILKTAQLNLEYTSIKAPIAGRIGRSMVTAGALVTAYQPTPLAVIQQLDPIYVDASRSTAEQSCLRGLLASGELTRRREHDQVKLILDDGRVYPHDGTLQFHEVAVDPSTGSFILRMAFPNPGKHLMPGMFIRALVTAGVNSQAILVPQQAIARTSKGEPYAMLVDAGNIVRRQPVGIERAVGNRWLVAAGLKAGDRIVVEGLQRILSGAPVATTPFESRD